MAGQKQGLFYPQHIYSKEGLACFYHCACMPVCLVMCDSLEPHHNPPLSMGFSRQEYQSGLQSPSPGDLPNPGIDPISPASPALAGRLFTTEPSGKPHFYHYPAVNSDRFLFEIFF